MRAVGIVVGLGLGVAGVAGAVATDAIVDAAAEAKVREALDGLELEDDVRVGDVDFRWLGLEIAVEDVVFLGEDLATPTRRVDLVACTWPTMREGVLASVSCRFEGAREARQAPGTREIVLDGSLLWDVDDQGRLLDEIELAWRGVARASWRLAVDGVTPELLRVVADGRAAPYRPSVDVFGGFATAAPDLALREAAVTFRDLGGRDELSRSLAEALGGDPSLVGPGLATSLETSLVLLGVTPGEGTRALEAFLTEGGALRIGTSIERPVPLVRRTAAGAVFAPSAGFLEAMGFFGELGVGVTHLP